MHLVHVLLVPPACLLLLALVGALLWKKKPRLARGLVVLSFVSVWGTSMPLCGGALLRSLQVDEPLAAGASWPDADAIVVLSAGALRDAPEYGGVTVDSLSLERLRYGAVLHRVTGKPILLTGGSPESDLPPIAELMRRVLVDEMKVPVQWVEDKSSDTWENATLSTPLLQAANVKRIYLVTHAWHMPRARRCFEQQGFEVVAAPTAFRAPQPVTVASLLPSSKGIRDTAWACHEWIGRAWYRVSKR